MLVVEIGILEAFNFHRAEIIERIEARQKEVETKTTRSFFLNLAPPATSQQKSNKTKPKPSSDKPVSSNRLQSNKENIKKNSRNYSTHYSNSSKQRSRQKNLNKYNQVMCKIYSQRLKSEILKGKVNFSRHEILMNT
ncbi:hypothetical protein JTE90_025232 [Oedothorax gibbosus]|uniref:Uncharacterized protein n=1 Tax=Oedothorax gibbosus TaxID=931172 RepID=A0AAV6U064_9ARAC|nr:hypothetical protein JTE90_025232 [Oedothorax gibbosus]